MKPYTKCIKHNKQIKTEAEIISYIQEWIQTLYNKVRLGVGCLDERKL